jgi:ATP-dependent DNA helicase RecG
MRTAQELFEELNSYDESVRIEAKKASEVGRSIMETICAFSNEPDLGGGYVLLGAVRKGFDENGLPHYEPENIANPDKIQTDIANQCASVFNVRIRPQIETEVVDGKTVVVVKVDEAPASQKPIYFEKRGLPCGAYRRIGPSDQKCSEDDMPVFYSSAESFDCTLVKGSSLDDIDENAVSYYRKLREKVNPHAEELTYDDTNLLLALRACEKDRTGAYVLTYTGLIVFGKSMALRRLMPALRVDYIRVQGNRWVENPDKRFESTIDMRGAFILLVNRALNAITDDLPKGFELKDGNLQASTPVDIPNDTLREAIVNAFIHRSFRVNQPIQIIRYSNRLEIINPGYSLKSPERLGEPGSELRNQYISSIFHETNLAETKGSGIKTMREQMKKAKLMPPTFESSRENNQFTTRLLFHHLLGKDDIEWLSLFAQHELNNEQRLSLIFVRELGAIDNITYRQLNSDITSRKATFDLHRMCEMGLFELKGQSRNAYYIAGPNLESHIGKNDGEMCRANDEMCRANGEMYRANGEISRANEENGRGDGLNSRGDGLNSRGGDLNSRGGGLNSRANGEMCRADGEMCRANDEMCRANDEMCRADTLPLVLQEGIKKIGKRAASSEIRSLIIGLCTFTPFGIAELAQLLNRDMKALRYHYINPLLKQGKLFYTIPEMLNHPNQKYTTKKKQ